MDFTKLIMYNVYNIYNGYNLFFLFLKNPSIHISYLSINY